MEKIWVKNLEAKEVKQLCETLFYDIEDRQCVNQASFLNEASINSEEQFLSKKLHFSTLFSG